ncbi:MULTISPECIES: hypothetical protein [unclassified Microcoleus]|uniref:hypothetical protein n=1 Tax=unclassified Microcoleus TaxID=2642155 RepID=UPI0025F71882|nr:MULTISPECIES: hypothetical protein [unclassified Microcoleus]
MLRLKISADRPNKAFPCQTVGWASRPSGISSVGWASRPSRLSLNLVQHRSRSPVKCYQRGLATSAHPRSSVNVEILLWTYR